MKRLQQALWRGYAIAAMGLGLGMLALICLCWLPFALLFHWLLPARQGRWLGRRMICWGFRGYLGFLRLCCGCRFQLDGLEQLASQGAQVVVANHPSLLDAVIILSRLPDAVCVMKAGLLDNLLFGAAARLAGYIRNDHPLKLVQTAQRELAGGAQLLIFPEGSRTRNFPLDRCLPSAGLIAQRAGVPVQTVLIEFSTPYLSKHWPLWRPPVLPLRCSLRLDRQFPPPQDSATFTADLENHLRHALAAAPLSASSSADSATIAPTTSPLPRAEQ